MTRQVLHRLNIQREQTHKYLYHTLCHIYNPSCAPCESYFSGRRLRHTALTIITERHFQEVKTLLPTSALYRDWHALTLLFSDGNTDNSVLLSTSPISSSDTLPKHKQMLFIHSKKKIWKTVTAADDQMNKCLVLNFLFAQFLPQKQSHTALVHDLMFWSHKINARHDHLTNILHCHLKLYRNEYDDYEKLKWKHEQ